MNNSNIRSSKFELCRVVAMFSIMLLHTTYYTFGDSISWPLIILASFSVVGVNVYVMITGYFTTRPKKTALLNLLFICVFWGICKIIAKKGLGLEMYNIDYFLITNSNWFIPSYICLVFFAPILNSYCEKASKGELVGGVISLLALEIYFDWIPPRPSFSLGSQNGYSVLSFIIIYLLARAIKLYGLPQWFRKYNIYIYVLSSLITAIMTFKLDNMRFWCIAYTNPFVIISSVAFFSIFESMSDWNSKVINRVAKSMLACLLGHLGLTILYTAQFKYLYAQYSSISLIALWVSAVLVAFFVCVLIDQLRIMLWQRIETSIRKFITNNELFANSK